MTATKSSPTLLALHGVDLDTPSGRALCRGLDLRLCRGEQVAVIGRNGVGKTSLLQVLAGIAPPSRGRAVIDTSPVVVPQHLAGETLTVPSSLGELRQRRLRVAFAAKPDLLILDEPTQDLDTQGRAWLAHAITAWPGALVVVTHDRRVLERFHHFFVIAETGCRYLQGTFTEIEETLLAEDDAGQEKYAQRLNVLAQRERKSEEYRLRRQRKKNVGRVRELGRATPRMRLNQKRSYAQEKQGRIEGIRQERLAETRAWAKIARRALSVRLPFNLVLPTLPAAVDGELVVLDEISAERGGRRLFSGLDLRLGRDRVAVVGPNGAGKTTLLDIMRGLQSPTSGVVRTDLRKLGAIAQGATDWMTSESLLDHLAFGDAGASPERIAQLLVAHRFPLALAARPLRSLSPGERTRAALICVLQRQPSVELLVLDEPTYALDLVGVAGLRAALAAWTGGCVVTSHDEAFVQAIGVTRRIVLDGRGGHRTLRE